MSAPDDDLVEAVARAINSADNEWAGAPRTAPHEPWPHAVARAVLSVPALRDALARDAKVAEIVARQDKLVLDQAIGFIEIRSLYPDADDGWGVWAEDDIPAVAAMLRDGAAR